MDRIEFIKSIEKRQNPIKDKLTMLNHGMSPIYNPFPEWKQTPNLDFQENISGKLEVTEKDNTNNKYCLSPGCQSCKDGSWWCLYVGHRCNLDCTYCPQGTAEDKRILVDHDDAMQRLWIRDIKFALQCVKPKTIKGISYSGGEPLMFLNKILDMGKFVSTNFPYIYQWCYTNGLLVTEDKLKMLVDAGLNEIRFHLGASNFHPDIVSRVKLACTIFDRVTIETPSNPKLKDWVINHDGLKKVVDYGVTQLNCAEMYYINERAREEYPNEPTYTYTSMARGRHISPIFSRHTTYDIIEYVIKEKIDIIINDCNHESRDSQLITRELNKNRLKEMY